MSTKTVAGREVHVDPQGFLTERSEWDETVADELARRIGIELTDRHRDVLRFLRADQTDTGETATLRRVSTRVGVPVKTLFELFPGKPSKKMAYIAGLPKPRGCV
jgi:TusE/DsrC/DsvC family sulfur relay protein